MSVKDPAAPKKRSWPMIFMCVWLIGLAGALAYYLLMPGEEDKKPTGKKISAQSKKVKKSIKKSGGKIKPQAKKDTNKPVEKAEAKPKLDTKNPASLEDKILILEEKLAESEKKREMEKQESQKTIDSLLSKLENLEKSVKSGKKLKTGTVKKAASVQPMSSPGKKSYKAKRRKATRKPGKKQQVRIARTKRSGPSASAPSGSYASRPPAVSTSYSPSRRRADYGGPWSSQSGPGMNNEKQYSGSSGRSLYDMSIRYGGSGDRQRSKLAPGVAVYPRYNGNR